MESIDSQMKQNRLKRNGKSSSVNNVSSNRNRLLSENFSTSTFPRLLKIERSKACSFTEIRRGADGINDVLKQMKLLVRNTSVFDTGFATWAVNKILINNGLNSNTTPELIFRAVYNWVYANIRYISDVKGVEAIRDARATISNGFGDCDDHAILIASMLSVLGFEPEFVIARTPRLVRSKPNAPYTQRLPREPNHIYTMVNTPFGRFFFDTTLENGQFNVEAATVRNRQGVKIWNDGTNPYIEGIGSFFKSIGKGIVKLAPVAANFIPIPGVGQAVGLAAGFANKAIAQSEANKNIDWSTLATDTNSALDTLIQAVTEQGADYSAAVKQGEAVVNNWIGLNNNRASKKQKEANKPMTDSITNKLNGLRAIDVQALAQKKAQAAQAATDAASGVAGIDSNVILYGVAGLGALFIVVKLASK